MNLHTMRVLRKSYIYFLNFIFQNLFIECNLRSTKTTNKYKLLSKTNNLMSGYLVFFMLKQTFCNTPNYKNNMIIIKPRQKKNAKQLGACNEFLK